MTFSGKNVLVTGAGGFIGSHLCEALVERGARVTAMVRYNGRSDRANLEYIPATVRDAMEILFGDIQDPFFVMDAVKNKDVVFHLAALIGIPYSYAAPESYVRTNVEGSLNVLEAARRHGVSRLVHTSTSETYGTALYSPIDENHALQGQSPYSATKIAADKLAESYHRSFGAPVAVLRPFNTYGPRQSARAVIPTIVTQATMQQSVRLGDLSPVRDLLFVADTVRGFLSAAESDAAIGRVINVGSGTGLTIGELAATILRIMHVDKPVVLEPQRVRPEASEVRHLICNNDRASEFLGWKPTVSLEDGLRTTIDYITANLDRYPVGTYVE
jgi:NAD dependent epimerase/dehydratase